MNINDIKVCLIAARSKNNVIGKDNSLPWHLPSELSYFKERTLNKPVIMGRNTYQSLGKALPDRINIVLSKDLNYEVEDALVCRNLNQAIKMARAVACYGTNPTDELFIIGGSKVYESAIELADKIYLTEVDLEVEGDSFFPAFNGFELVESNQAVDGDITYNKNVYSKMV